MIRHRRFSVIIALTSLGAGSPASAASLKSEQSFRVGTGGVLCTAQSQPSDPALKGMFDRAYRIVCRDAATPVGSLYAFRTGLPAMATLLPRGDSAAVCEAPVAAPLAGLPGAMALRCTQGPLAYLAYSVAGKTSHAAVGLAGYASALQLGLRSLVADATVPGDVEVAITGSGDAAAFARVQAGSLDASQALAEGYVRNNTGSFAESSEFFDLLIIQNRQGSPGFTRTAEYLANQALQQSNLGNFAAAETLFASTGRALDRTDPVLTRLVRNYRAMHQLNRHAPDAALVELARAPVSLDGTLDLDRVGKGFIDVPLSQKLNSDDDSLVSVGSVDNRLTTPERAAVLDGQALYLRGAALRMLGRDTDSMATLDAADTALGAVREGRVSNAARLQAAISVQRSGLFERAGRAEAARQQMDKAIATYRIEYPRSAVLLAVEAQRAGLLARQGREDEAIVAYRAIVAASPTTAGAGQSVRLLLSPYFALLSQRNNTADAASDFFDVSQILVRPGVAQTQAVLARELSGGSDAAAGLFRQSLTLSRDIIRTETEINGILAKPVPDPDDAVVLIELRRMRATHAADQTAVLAKLSDNPRYRSVSNNVVTLKDLQGRLKADEAYYKLLLVNQSAYALFVTPDRADILRVDASADQLGEMVRALRDTIVKFENGRAATYPFDARTARKLYLAMFAPVSDKLQAVQHLVFEPDGALLQLPINLLIEDDDGLTAYEKRVDTDDGDAFDMRDIAWLGRNRAVSTSVSPRSFMDVRALMPSRGTRGYLGLGENAPPSGDSAGPVALAQGSTLVRIARTRAGAAAIANADAIATPIPSRDPCDWPLNEWRKPISAAELRIGADLVGKGNAEIVLGSLFTDTNLAMRKDLRNFRVIHFATHGLVTAPRPECPARPALLTSFGSGDSDGLLSFREVFDLQLDADTIILSACDTAGTATVAATREAGVATGGNSALDGLVRAFVGAGARAVIASHWPVPDNFDATKTLITGLFSQNGAISVGEALRISQVRLMDAADTSHPYYWSGFAIIGDSAKPLSGSLGAAPAVTAAVTAAVIR